MKMPMKNDRMKRVALVLMLSACALLLGGCAGQIEQRTMLDLSDMPVQTPAEAPMEDGAQDKRMLATLYYLSRDGAELLPVTREITARGGESRAQAALEALLAGPEEGDALWPDLGGGIPTRLLEVSSGVATVNLPAHARTLDPQMLYAVRMAIANTLTEFSEISHVNVLIGGREEGLDLGATLPVGTMTREDNLDVRAQYSRRYEQRLSTQGVSLLTTLYFPSQDGGLLLPQVRNVSYAQVSPIEYLYTLLGELGKGASGALYASEIPAPLDYIEEMPEIVRTEDGYLAIEICMSSALDDALYASGLTRGIYLAMLSDTLLGFVPGVEGLRISIGSRWLSGIAAQDTPDGEEIHFEQGLANRDAFSGYVGAPMTLYAMDEHTNGLMRMQRTAEQAEQNDPRARLAALMRLSHESVFALPERISAQDILAVHVGEDLITVNLSEAFADALSKLEPDQERAAVYAMVNTLTEGMDASKVAFFFDGQQIGTLAGGLEMRGVFMRNPGMVVTDNGSMGVL